MIPASLTDTLHRGRSGRLPRLWVRRSELQCGRAFLKGLLLQAEISKHTEAWVAWTPPEGVLVAAEAALLEPGGCELSCVESQQPRGSALRVPAHLGPIPQAVLQQRVQREHVVRPFRAFALRAENWF